MKGSFLLVKKNPPQNQGAAHDSVMLAHSDPQKPRAARTVKLTRRERQGALLLLTNKTSRFGCTGIQPGLV